MDLLDELSNKKEKNKVKSKKISENFKYYSQEINVDKENPISEEYKNIYEKLLNIDLNQSYKSINEGEMKYLESITKEKCLEVLKEKLEEKATYYNKETKPTKKEIVSIITQTDKYNLESDNEKEDNIINKKENINNSTIIPSMNKISKIFIIYIFFFIYSIFFF